VTPFKGQNMALNVCHRYWWRNGYANSTSLGIHPIVEMNPILLKPQGDMTSGNYQRKMTGKVSAQITTSNILIWWRAIEESLQRQAEFDLIV